MIPIVFADKIFMQPKEERQIMIAKLKDTKI